MMEFKRLYDAFVSVNESVGVDILQSQNVELKEKQFKGENCELDFNSFQKNSLEYAIQFVKKQNVVLLLKGPTTYVISQNIINKVKNDGISYKSENSNTKLKSSNGINIRISAIDRGNPGMATAGSGDVLSGIITGFLGYMGNEFDAVRVSAFVNGLAGELAARDEGEISMTSSDTIKHISEAIKFIKNENV